MQVVLGKFLWLLIDYIGTSECVHILPLFHYNHLNDWFERIKDANTK